MSWNNIIPMKFIECQMICGDSVDDEGYTIHKPDCPIGKELSTIENDKLSDDQSKEE